MLAMEHFKREELAEGRETVAAKKSLSEVSNHVA